MAEATKTAAALWAQAAELHEELLRASVAGAEVEDIDFLNDEYEAIRAEAIKAERAERPSA